MVSMFVLLVNRGFAETKTNEFNAFDPGHVPPVVPLVITVYNFLIISLYFPLCLHPVKAHPDLAV